MTQCRYVGSNRNALIKTLVSLSSWNHIVLKRDYRFTVFSWIVIGFNCLDIILIWILWWSLCWSTVTQWFHSEASKWVSHHVVMIYDCLVWLSTEGWTKVMCWSQTNRATYLQLPGIIDQAEVRGPARCRRRYLFNPIMLTLLQENANMLSILYHVTTCRQ